MTKTFPASQVPLIERPYASPIYFAHIYLPGETLYFSDRNIKFNGHDYEAYIQDIPELMHSIEEFGGYLNIDAQLTFWNKRFRSYDRLIDFFIANPLTRRDVDLFVLYIENGQIPPTDVSTKLHKFSFTNLKNVELLTFSIGLSTILHSIDKKKLFIQINRTNWPNAAPTEIGKYENRCIGSMRDVPCQCVKTGAVTTLAVDATANAAVIFLTETDYPIAFASSGTVQIGSGLITYTGKDSVNKKLTGCTWSIPARNKKRGEPVWQIETDYKYLIDSGKIKSASNVKVAGVKVAAGDCSINLNEGGKSVITFTHRNLLRNQGAHSHDTVLIEQCIPPSSSFTYSSGMGAAGEAAYLRDRNEESYCHVGVSGVTDGNKTAYFTATFGTYTGQTPDRIYACVLCDDQLGSLENEWFGIDTPQTIAIGILGYSQPKQKRRYLLSGTSVPSTLRVRAQTYQGTPANPCFLIANVYEMYLELEFDSIPSGGENAIWQKLVPLVTCDVEGYPDTVGGIYTGTASALIQNCSDVRRFMLVGLLGRSMTEIGDSFLTARTRYANRITGGYKFAMLLNALGETPEGIFKKLDEQSSSQMREDGGKFELDFSLTVTLSQYPPAQSGTYVKATSTYSGNYQPWFATDPAKLLTDSQLNNSWLGAAGSQVNQRFHIDLGSAKIIQKIYYENHHNSGANTNTGAKNFTFWGSNDPASFAELTYGTDTGWTQLTTSQPSLDQHIGANQEDPKYITVTNSVAYRYYAFKFADNWGAANSMGIRRVELMYSDSQAYSTINSTIYVEEPIFEETSATEISNLIRAKYNKDWSGGGGLYLSQTERKDDPSISDLGELPEDIEFMAVQSQAMAEDVTDWRLLHKKRAILKVTLVCKPSVRKYERGDLFILNDVPVSAWEGLKWRVLEIKEIPDRQAFSIRAIQYISE